MKVRVRHTSLVQPVECKPRHRIWLSNLDLVHPKTHLKSIYVYSTVNHSDSSDGCNAEVLKDALRKALVPFYPMAGRLGRDGNGRLELDCNGEGVLFQEADTETTIAELGEFLPRAEDDELTELVPGVDYSKGISSYPLLLLQVTRFKCGGVSLGIGTNHNVVDGTSALSFISTWSEMARGMNNNVAATPLMDRTILKARQHEDSKLHKAEYDAHPAMISDGNPQQQQRPPKPTITNVIKITQDQLRALKDQGNPSSDESETRYSTYEILSAHIWRCATKARRLANEQPTKLQIPVDTRSRLNPPIPQGYFGNVVIHTSTIATAGELVREPMVQTVERIRQTINRIDDEYLRSAISCIEDSSKPEGVAELRPCQSPNLEVVSWLRLTFKSIDFGWGSPILIRKLECIEGTGHLLPRDADGNLSLQICLEAEAMADFQRLFYETD